MELRLAVVQPETLTGPEAPKNVDRAVAYIRQAARDGAKLVMLPETYPGPYTVPVNYSPHEALAAVAGEEKVYVVGVADVVRADVQGREVLGLQVPGSGRAAGVGHGVRQARHPDVQRGLRARAVTDDGPPGRADHAFARRALAAPAPRDLAHAHLGARDREPDDHRDEPQHPRGRQRPRHDLHSRGDPARVAEARCLHRDRRSRAPRVAARRARPPGGRHATVADQARHLQAVDPPGAVSGLRAALTASRSPGRRATGSDAEWSLGALAPSSG